MLIIKVFNSNTEIKRLKIHLNIINWIQPSKSKQTKHVYCSKTIRRTQKGKPVQNEIDAEIKALNLLSEVETGIGWFRFKNDFSYSDLT